MSDIPRSASRTLGYVLSEESHLKLQAIRDQLFLMALITLAVTDEEEDESLELRRSMLGQCFENFGLQIDEVLDAIRWPGRVRESSSGSH